MTSKYRIVKVTLSIEGMDEVIRLHDTKYSFKEFQEKYPKGVLRNWYGHRDGEELLCARCEEDHSNLLNNLSLKLEDAFLICDECEVKEKMESLCE